MATKKTIASTAKKSAKIVAMAAVAVAQVVDMDKAAYQQAMADMADEYGQENVCQMVYMNPFDLIA